MKENGDLELVAIDEDDDGIMVIDTGRTFELVLAINENNQQEVYCAYTHPPEEPPKLKLIK